MHKYEVALKVQKYLKQCKIDIYQAFCHLWSIPFMAKTNLAQEINLHMWADQQSLQVKQSQY